MNYRILYILLLSLITLTACDQISESDRYIPVEQVTANKRLLFEDYTGQRCVYCPEGAAVAENLKQQYGENIIVVSMHAGSLSLRPFATDIGKEYNDYFGITANPTALVDRKEMSDKYKTEWNLLVAKYIVEEPTVDIQLSSSYNAETGEINIQSKIFNINQENPLTLNLWIIENNIIATQLTPDGYDSNYVHKHVFRDAVNDTWGKSVSVNIGESITVEDKYMIDKEKGWKAEEIHIVGFISNETNRQVLQAVEITLIKN